MSLFVTCVILTCVFLVTLRFLPSAPPKAMEGVPPSSTVPRRATCPPQVEGSTSIPAAFSNDETLFIVEPLSSPLPPTTPSNISSICHSGPSTVLVENGLCFSHAGDRGGLTIVSRLLQYRITHFTIDNSAADRISHPYHLKEGTLWGLVEGDIPSNLTSRWAHTVSDKATYVVLGTFCFDPTSAVSQTYPVQGTVAAHDRLKFSVFYLEIESNWGGSHTCFCHIKLHGEELHVS